MADIKIKIGDREVGLFFGYTCYQLFIASCFKHKSTHLTDGGELTGLGLVKLFHAAHQNYCFKHEIAFEVDIDEMAEWVDQQYKTDEGQNIIIDLCAEWAKSKEIKKLVDDNEKEQEKKSLNQITESPILTN